MRDTRTISAPPESEVHELSPWLRVAVYAFLVVFLVCGAFAVERWPLTGFRLYSGLRVEERHSPSVVALLADGGEERLRFDDLPMGWHATDRILRQFPRMTQGERDEVCDAWVQPLRDEGVDVVGVRVDDMVAHLGDPDRPTEAVAVLWECGA